MGALFLSHTGTVRGKKRPELSAIFKQKPSKVRRTTSNEPSTLPAQPQNARAPKSPARTAPATPSKNPSTNSVFKAEHFTLLFTRFSGGISLVLHRSLVSVDFYCYEQGNLPGHKIPRGISLVLHRSLVSVDFYCYEQSNLPATKFHVEFHSFCIGL